MSTATTNGPLDPGPNPSANRSKACRVVSEGGSLLASVKASRMLNSGAASASSTSTASVPTSHGRFWTSRLQRCQKPSGGGGPPFWSRPGRCSLSIALPENPSSAGSRVKAAMRTMSTAAMQATASPMM